MEKRQTELSCRKCQKTHALAAKLEEGSESSAGSKKSLEKCRDWFPAQNSLQGALPIKASLKIG